MKSNIATKYKLPLWKVYTMLKKYRDTTTKKMPHFSKPPLSVWAVKYPER
jgi:hypothetical protein